MNVGKNKPRPLLILDTNKSFRVGSQASAIGGRLTTAYSGATKIAICFGTTSGVGAHFSGVVWKVIRRLIVLTVRAPSG